MTTRDSTPGALRRLARWLFASEDEGSGGMSKQGALRNAMLLLLATAGFIVVLAWDWPWDRWAEYLRVLVALGVGGSCIGAWRKYVGQRRRRHD